MSIISNLWHVDIYLRDGSLLPIEANDEPVFDSELKTVHIVCGITKLMFPLDSIKSLIYRPLKLSASGLVEPHEQMQPESDADAFLDEMEDFDDEDDQGSSGGNSSLH